ncbi:MAG: hypothetical protein H6618_09870 [Deltaproteobacteria bacterium]|nr:hypothetical protein [Deltaproteobacteria bacterium]
MKYISVFIQSFPSMIRIVTAVSLTTGMFAANHLIAQTEQELSQQERSPKENSGKEQMIRKRNLSSEGRFRKNGDKTTIDFDSTDIVGSRRRPLGSMISQSKADQDYNFVKIRMRWHPEMINSTSSLGTDAP